MAVSGVVAAYRLHAAQCTEIAQRSRDLETKLALLTMAQAWLTLADRALKNSETIREYEMPTVLMSFIEKLLYQRIMSADWCRRYRAREFW